ncbi:MAG: hypothetical protein GX567_18315, partial [Clostridia bacterium]|nr:hypothetical protein [Clostridia bacterium]
QFQIVLDEDPEHIITYSEVAKLPSISGNTVTQGEVLFKASKPGTITFHIQAQGSEQCVQGDPITLILKKEASPELPTLHYITNLYSNRTLKQFGEQSGFYDVYPEWTFQNPDTIVTANDQIRIQGFSAHYEPADQSEYGFDTIIPVPVTTVSGIGEDTASDLMLSETITLAPKPLVIGAPLENKEDAEDQAYTFEFKSLTPKLASVSQTGLVTPLKVGNAKIRITMTVAGKKKFIYDKTIKIVRTREVTGITIISENEQEYPIDQGTITAPISAANDDTGTLKTEIPIDVLIDQEKTVYTAEELDWSSSDTSVAQVKFYIDSNQNRKPKIVLNGSTGVAVIKASYTNDKATKDVVSDSIRIIAKDYVPKIDEMYVYDDIQKTLITVTSEEDVSEIGISLVGKEISYLFKLTPVSGTDQRQYTLEAKEIKDTHNQIIKIPNGIYSGQIKIPLVGGDTYNCPIKIKVQRAKPDAKVKLLYAPNLFYRDGVGKFSVSGKDADKVIVNNIYNLYYSVDYDPNTKIGTIYQKKSYINANYASIPSVVRIAIPVSFNGYLDHTDQTFILPVKTKKTKALIKSDQPVVYFYPEQNIKSSSIQLYDQINAKILNSSTSIDFADLNASYVSKIGIGGQDGRISDSGSIDFSMIGSEKINQIVKLKLSNDNWREHVYMTQKFMTTMQKPALQLSKTQMQFNLRQAEKNGRVQDSFTYSIKNNTELDQLKKPRIFAQNAYAKSLLPSLMFTYDLREGKINTILTNAGVSAGTANFILRFDLDSGTYIEKSFRIRVVDKKPTVTISKKGKIDLLDPESGVTVIPNIKDSNLSAKHYSLIGPYSDLFILTCADDLSSFIIKVKDDDTYDTTVRNCIRAGKTYKLSVKYDLGENDDSASIFYVNVNVTQSAPTVTASKKNITLFNTYTGDLYGSTLTFASQKELATAELMNYNDIFSYDANKQLLYMKDSASFKKTQKSKSYVLQFKVPYQYADLNKKSKVVKVTVKVIR